MEKKPRNMTQENLRVYSQFEDDYINQTGFLGELAVDKSLEKLGVDFSTNKKGSIQKYSDSRGGPDQRIGNHVFIETKNWGRYEISLDMYKRKMKKRLTNVKGGVKIVVMGCANLSMRAETALIKDDIFLVVIGEQVRLWNFDSMVRTLEKKLRSVIRKRAPHLLGTQFIASLFSAMTSTTLSITLSFLSLLYKEPNNDSLTNSLPPPDHRSESSLISATAAVVILSLVSLIQRIDVPEIECILSIDERYESL